MQSTYRSIGGKENFRRLAGLPWTELLMDLPHTLLSVCSLPHGGLRRVVLLGGWGVPTWVRALFVLGAQAKRERFLFRFPETCGGARVPEKKRIAISANQKKMVGEKRGDPAGFEGELWITCRWPSRKRVFLAPFFYEPLGGHAPPCKGKSLGLLLDWLFFLKGGGFSFHRRW